MFLPSGAVLTPKFIASFLQICAKQHMHTAEPLRSCPDSAAWYLLFDTIFYFPVLPDPFLPRLFRCVFQPAARRNAHSTVCIIPGNRVMKQNAYFSRYRKRAITSPSLTPISRKRIASVLFKICGQKKSPAAMTGDKNYRQAWLIQDYLPLFFLRIASVTPNRPIASIPIPAQTAIGLLSPVFGESV